MTGTDPRKTALEILNALDRGNTTLDRIVSEKFGPGAANMSPRDLNLSYALVYGVLRWRGRIDWIISRFSRDRIEKIDPVVINILRLGLFQIFYMDRIPESAAVNTSVEIAKQTAPHWVVRFVNGLLRNVIRNKDLINWPDMTADPLLHISVTHSFPLWLVSRWMNRFGREETISLCSFLNTIAPLTIRTNTLKTSREDLLDRLENAADSATPTPYAPEGIMLEGVKSGITELPGFKEGLYQIQDEAAQLVARILAPAPGQTVLDACAGLGGKTAHIAQLMNNSGRLTAIDKDGWKLAALESEMNRLGVTIVSVNEHDLNHDIDPSARGLYDQVLVDAPCSGLGVIRRNPDTKWSSAPTAFSRYRKTQLRFLHNASQAVRTGGILVYAVCSIAPEETDEVISIFLQKHNEFTIDSIPDTVARHKTLINDRGFARSYPHIHHMDGFFIARMKKIS